MVLQDVNLRKWKRQQGNYKCLYTKGKLGNFLLAQNLCRSQTKRNLNRHFSSKSPKVSQKSGQIVQNLQQKKDQKASDLLRESTIYIFGHQTSDGIHQLFSDLLSVANVYILNEGLIQHVAQKTHYQHKNSSLGIGQDKRQQDKTLNMSCIYRLR